jgi:hypothetical protein
VASGYGYRGWLYFPLHLACAFCQFVFNPSLLSFAFYSITFQLSLRFSLRSTFPDGVLYGIQHDPSLTIWISVIWNISNFTAFMLPGIIRETCVSLFFPFFNSTF